MKYHQDTMRSIITSVAAASRVCNISRYQIERVIRKGTSVFVYLKKGGVIECSFLAFYNDFHAGRKAMGKVLATNGAVFGFAHLLKEDKPLFWHVTGRRQIYLVTIEENEETGERFLDCECRDYFQQKESEEVKVPFCKHCWAVVAYEKCDSFQTFSEKVLKPCQNKHH